MSAGSGTRKEAVVIIGAGPAGLTAAYELVKRDCLPVVLEKQLSVGGLAKTENYKGFHFDMGGHRFFTKNRSVEAMWREILRKDFLRRPRLSRIYYRRKFFAYPLRPFDALKGLGPFEAVRIVASYLWWHFFPHSPEDTFDKWVTNRFGQRLFDTFFRAYTEKVWGIPCSELKAEWAAQRIKGLSLRIALLNMISKPRRAIKTLIEEFDYPRLGPGMMWEATKRVIEGRGGSVRLGADVLHVCRAGARVESVVIRCNDRAEIVHGSHFLSSMPVSELVQKLDPPPPPAVLQAAKRLAYRDFLTVCLIVNKPRLFPDNWIYVQDPDVRVGRIQNFKNWSPEMVPDERKTSLGLEYFCSAGDDFWELADDKLVDLAKHELERIGIAKSADVEDGCVFRVPNAYPIYDSGYADSLETVRTFIDGLENLQTMGRCGLHRYNNQDHAMITAKLAVENLIDGRRTDLWAVNTDPEYHEEMEIREVAEATPEEIVTSIQHAVERVLPKLDRMALGAAVGTLVGLGIFMATLWLRITDGPSVGSHLRLLSQYFPGYTVSGRGSVLGLGYGFLLGFVVGWLFALLRNGAIFLYMAGTYRGAEHRILHRLLEHL